MTENAGDWARLSQITETVFEAAATRMAQLRQREAVLRATLSALEAERKTGADPASLPLDDPAQRAGAAVLWLQWIDKRRSKLNAELARTLVQIDISRTALLRAHGRHQATEHLAREAEKTMRTKRELRREQGVFTSTLFE